MSHGGPGYYFQKYAYTFTYRQRTDRGSEDRHTNFESYFTKGTRRQSHAGETAFIRDVIDNHAPEKLRKWIQDSMVRNPNNTYDAYDGNRLELRAHGYRQNGQDMPKDPTANGEEDRRDPPDPNRNRVED